MTDDADTTIRGEDAGAAAGRPELLVAGAFASGLLVAIVLRQVVSDD